MNKGQLDVDQEFKAPKDLCLEINGLTNDALRDPSFILNN